LVFSGHIIWFLSYRSYLSDIIMMAKFYLMPAMAYLN